MDFHEEDDDIIRSSRSQVFSKIGALKKFAIFLAKRLCWSLFFIKLLDLNLELYSKETPRQVFSCVQIVKILSTTFLTEHF